MGDLTNNFMCATTSVRHGIVVFTRLNRTILFRFFRRDQSKTTIRAMIKRINQRTWLLGRVTNYNGHNIGALVIKAFDSIPSTFDVLRRLDTLNLTFFVPRYERSSDRYLHIVRAIRHDRFITRRVHYPILQCTDTGRAIRHLDHHPRSINTRVMIF